MRLIGDLGNIAKTLESVSGDNSVRFFKGVISGAEVASVASDVRALQGHAMRVDCGIDERVTNSNTKQQNRLG